MIYKKGKNKKDSFENGRPLVLLSVDQGTDSASTWCFKKWWTKGGQIVYGERQCWKY